MKWKARKKHGWSRWYCLIPTRLCNDWHWLEWVEYKCIRGKQK
jgi:hypothetical protein